MLVISLFQNQSDLIFRMKWEVACILWYIQLTAIHIILDLIPHYTTGGVYSSDGGILTRSSLCGEETPPGRCHSQHHQSGETHLVTCEFTAGLICSWYCQYFPTYSPAHRQVYGSGTSVLYDDSLDLVSMVMPHIYHQTVHWFVSLQTPKFEQQVIWAHMEHVLVIAWQRGWMPDIGTAVT